MVITLEKDFLWPKVILYCPRCETSTVHALSQWGTYYSCACGEKIDIEFKENEDEGL